MMDQAGPSQPGASEGPDPARPAGPARPVGPTGPVGAHGPVGPTGPVGAHGPVGPTGPVGAHGPVGPTGPADVHGPAGPADAPGPAGARGSRGSVRPSENAARPAPGPDLAAELRRFTREPRAARPPSQLPRFDHPVVVGFDGSPSSRHALAYAAGMARRIGQSLVVAYIAPGVFCEPMTGQVIIEQTAREETERWLLSELDQVCDRTGLEVSIVTRRGNPSRELAAVADAVCADGLVIGAPGSIWHRIAGSVPGWLARHAHCPVIVVP
jgi:nucleotide-binding universal stress UspA family protein